MSGCQRLRGDSSASGCAKDGLFDDARTKDSALAKFSRSFAGRSGGLPDNYGLSYEDLAIIMNEWRRRATNRT